MATLNKVLLIGRLTRDPDKRSTPAGLTVVEIGLAVSRRFKSNSGEDREEVCFVDVTVWGKTAEACAEHLRKGSSCFIEGRLKLDQWEKDGQKRSKMTVVADAVQFLDRRAAQPEQAKEQAPAQTQGRKPVQQEMPTSNDDRPDDDIPF